MTTVRDGESLTAHFRETVIEQDEQGFWFKTREGVRLGPFKNKVNALLSRQMFIYQVTGDERLKPRAEIDEMDVLEVEEAEYILPDQEKSA
jgi:hypothetical protein